MSNSLDQSQSRFNEKRDGDGVPQGTEDCVTTAMVSLTESEHRMVRFDKNFQLEEIKLLKEGKTSIQAELVKNELSTKTYESTDFGTCSTTERTKSEILDIDTDIDLEKGEIWWPHEVGIRFESLPEKIELQSSNGSSQPGKRLLNPSLCRYCRVFFDTWTEVLRRISYLDRISSSHYSTYRELESSARQGCHLCKLFTSIKIIRSKNRANYSKSLPKHEPVRGRISLRKFFTLPKSKLVDRTVLKLEWWQNQETSFMVTIIPQMPHQSDEMSQAEHQLNTIVSPKFGCGANSLILARHWLEQCCTTHKACQNNNQEKKPTRLVGLGDGKVRLCLAAELENCSKYATLSHCWGGFEFLCLLQRNISEFLKEIPYKSLTKTFRDAIDIARALGFSWIWIDSLCIIQDDIEDWKKESSLMASVYSSSSLNIAATAAPDGRTGCLFDRDSTYAFGCPIEIESNSENIVYNCIDSNFFEVEIFKAPLIQRAWILQERILAPRTLHFASSQLIWECKTKFACEAFPDNIPQLSGSKIHNPTKLCLEEWESMVCSYSKASLTFLSDKLVAIAGLARRIAEQTGDTYIVGLWKKSFENDLCWKVYHSNPNMAVDSPVSLPSWSWAAFTSTAEIFIYKRRLLSSYIKILDISVELETNDPFGSVKGGATLSISSKDMIRATPGSKFENFNLGTGCGGEIYWDYYGFQDKEFIFLPIGLFAPEYLGLKSVRGLALKPTGTQNGQFKRVGSFYYASWLDESLESVSIGDLNPRKPGVINPLTSEDYISVNVDDEGAKWYTITII